jgi:N6-adenosine-specific RNA methylase IME4
MSRLEFHPLANIFPLLDDDQFDDFIEDIRVNGLREPIVVFQDAILDGRNRYRACLEAGVEPIFEPYEGQNPLGYVISLNLRRRHLNASQRAMVAARIATLGHGGDRSSGKFAACPTQEQAAEMLNVSERSVRSAREVLDEGVSELAAKVERGEVSVSAAADIASLTKEEQCEQVARGEKEILKAAKEIRARKSEASLVKRLERIAEISKGNSELKIKQRYPVIYADPPWRYENPPMGDTNRSIENHYPTMNLEEICALPVGDLATDDAILYLWTTTPKLAECMDVVSAWGFEYRTNFVWVKDKIGMGYYARNQHEILLVCRRGEFPPPAARDRVSSVIEAVRGAHSEKPERFYELIESFYPQLPKIELFSRSTRDGWASWGNEAVKFQ